MFNLCTPLRDVTDTQSKGRDMIEIDLAKAKSLIAECIEERGEEYKYEKEDGTSSCRYVHGIEEIPTDEDCFDYEDSYTNATPGCLIGLALHKAGVPLEELGKGLRNESGSIDLLAKLERENLVKVTFAASNYFANAQSSQDGGAPWGKSADAAARGKVLESKYSASGMKLEGEFIECSDWAVSEENDK